MGPITGTVPLSNFTSVMLPLSSNPAPRTTVNFPTMNPRGPIPSSRRTVHASPSAISTTLTPQPAITMATVNPSIQTPVTAETPSTLIRISANVQLHLLQALVSQSLQSSVSGISQGLLGRTPSVQPFEVTFITNKVKKCYGCNALFTDLEWTSPDTSATQNFGCIITTKVSYNYTTRCRTRIII